FVHERSPVREGERSMTIRKRAGGIALGLVAVVLMGRLPLVAQEPGTPKGDAPAAKRKYRVPDYFGQIGLTDQQRASIQAIQVKRHEKIDALEKQVAAEKAALLAECEG